jgi:hypothetical protein
MGGYSIDDGQENPWRRRSKLAFAIAAPPAMATVVIAGGLWAGGFDTKGCAGDHPCLTDRHHGGQLDPNFDWDGGTVRGTPILRQKLVYSPPINGAAG